MKRKKLNYSLPQDVMIEILMRLPFESILALKLVSKQWKDLINDPKFFNRYRDQSLVVIHMDDGLYCLLVRHGKKISVTVNERRHPPFTMCHMTTDSPHLLDLRWLVTCNWMTYTSKGHCFHLYNLLTGASYTVKNSVPRQEQPPIIVYNSWLIFHGFGYDGYDDDYKIVSVYNYKMRDFMVDKKLIRSFQNEENGLFWVYSLRNRVWKRFEGFPYATYDWNLEPRPHLCSLNGFLHWGTAKRLYPRKPVIVTYDLHTCGFGEMSVPDGYDHFWANVGELRGQLCCWNLKQEFHVWVMREYGVSESWTMLFHIDVSTVNRRNFRVWVEPAALYECQDGRRMLLLVCRKYGSLYWYDDHNDELKKVIHRSTWQKRRVVGGRGTKKSLIVAKN